MNKLSIRVTNTLRKQLRCKLIEPLFIVKHVRAK